jgi:hypothetical protein
MKVSCINPKNENLFVKIFLNEKLFLSIFEDLKKQSVHNNSGQTASNLKI